MDMLIIYAKENGYPKIIFDKGEGIFYDDRLYTEVKPPEGIYLPCEFIDGQWIGSTKEDFELEAKELQKLMEIESENQKTDKEPNAFISNLILKQAELEEEIKKTNEVNATLLLMLANREGVTDV
ncbi:hypothetical protein [Staphylococcus felis]|uniref:Uncharacterized protein n=1 Tax=Staphylococcus felis TaxID=46127 RepID=A0ABS0QPP8_9STAP|nr:hypothetical protein [Staphylococcus felis]MBH9580872.1 hypothetical protein [Staphylococcus felis]